MKILNWLRNWVGVLILLLATHLVCCFSLLNGNGGHFDLNHITLSDWKASELPSNRYLSVSEFHIGKPFDFFGQTKNDHPRTLIPLFETKEEAEQPRQISFIAIADHIMSNTEVEQLRKSNSIHGIATDLVVRADDYTAPIIREYGGVTIAADFMYLGKRPSFSEYCLAFAILLLGVPFSLYILVRRFAWFGTPASKRQAYLMTLAGATCFGGLACWRLQYGFSPTCLLYTSDADDE